MGEEALAQRLDPGEAVVGGHRGLDDVGVEDLLGEVDRRELQLLLGTEVGVEPALAHPDGLRKPADREPVDALDGREAGGSVEDRLPASLAVGAAAALAGRCGLAPRQSHA